MEGKKKENIDCILNSEKVQELLNGAREMPIGCVTGHSDKRWILNGCDLTSLWAGIIDEIYLANLMGFILIPLSQNYCYLCHKIKSKKDELVKINLKNSSCNTDGKWIQKHILKWSNETQSQI